MDKYYTASKSRSQGRDSWAVIFRHPVRLDANGKPGRRVRRGLGTTDSAEADRLVEQLNQLLRTPELWGPSARPEAAARYEDRVVDIFFDGVEGIIPDHLATRDRLLPAPGHEQGYRSVLMLGTTGAGKTTLVRQLLGTDPDTERFPSTSTAKTTVADTELILDPAAAFRCCVTFVSRDEVIDYLGECISEAALAAFRGASDAVIARRMLDHPNQRFRFSYILGRGTVADDDDTDDEVELTAPDNTPGIDLIETAAVLDRSVRSLKELVSEHAAEVKESLADDDEHDERLIEELIEENMDDELRRDERFHEIADALFDEVEKRFSLLAVGQLTRNRQGWPVSWEWSTEDRSSFLKAVTRFTSNYAPLFGTLLTPLVSGIRVAGPFEPSWAQTTPRLVIVDGEGLGHTPNSAAALSTSVSKRIEDTDAVVLVDNAAQPMQAAPVAAMKAVVTSGNASKLLFCFTHFDMVKGDNLPTFSEREAHVKASAENVLKSLGEDLGPMAERALRERLENGCFFVADIDQELNSEKKAGKRTIQQLNGLLAAVHDIIDVPEVVESRPVFDRINLVLAVREAASSFHDAWQGRLGLTYSQDHPKEHWTRIKALSRRFAEGFADEYDTLKPVSELKRELDEQIFRMLQQPVRWDGAHVPSDDEQLQVINTLANAISKEITELSTRRVRAERQAAWREAYAQSGKGSTFDRARIISTDVYDRAAPVPTVTPSPDQNSFLHEVAAAVEGVCTELRVSLR